MSAAPRVRLPHTRQHFQLWGAARVNPFTGMQLAERQRECSFAPLSLQKRASMGVSPSAHTEGFWEDHNRPSGWFPFTASWYPRRGRCCVGVSPFAGEISPKTGRTPGFDRETTAEIKCQCWRDGESREGEFAEGKVKDDKLGREIIKKEPSCWARLGADLRKMQRRV